MGVAAGVKSDNLIQAKSFAFAVRIVRLARLLADEQREYVLSKQLLRCGANVEEAIGGQTRPDFYAKLSVAYKEAGESLYWLRLLRETGYLSEAQFEETFADADELCRILAAIKKSTKANS